VLKVGNSRRTISRDEDFGRGYFCNCVTLHSAVISGALESGIDHA